MDARKRIEGNGKAALFLTFALFAVWPVGHRLYDALLPQFARVFSLRDLDLALTQSIRSIVYFLGAIPAALYARRFGYKTTILLGLGMFCVGAFLFYPAAETRQFGYFIGAACVMSCGWVVLEIGANPLIVSLGSTAHAIQRLNLAQALYLPGAFLGLWIGRWLVEFNLALPAANLARSIVHPYIVLGIVLLVLAFLIEETKFPIVPGHRRRGGAAAELRALLSLPEIRIAMAVQCFSILAQVSLWMQIVPLGAAARFPPPGHYVLTDVFAWAVALFCLGRFVGTALMMRFTPRHVLAGFSLAGLVVCLFGVAAGGTPAVIGALVASFFVSIAWPTVLGFAIRDLGPPMKLATALICMGAAVGGVAYRLLILVWTPPVQETLLVPAVSFAVLFGYAQSMAKRRATGLAAHQAEH